ncbi:hypothetical protein AMATHDRAFT_153050 [Amanita thiersii Skay4041]|uniref:Uncharacterized protein n=1 Tax=Amanita thiersii Skay4041 TaxID=703135 RepID=A0A2A9NHB7_9AGAR|nr:hypothetical protein AMATHDRAFT_153050 [Amanita thiersii Skay4041]
MAQVKALANEVLPISDATITVRIIKSFEFRTERSLILHHLNLEKTSVDQLKNIVRQSIHSQSSWKPYHNVELNTLKLYSKAHGAKTTNLIINLDHDDWILDEGDIILADLGFENETEVSFFNRDSYEKFKRDPKVSKLSLNLRTEVQKQVSPLDELGLLRQCGITLKCIMKHNLRYQIESPIIRITD